MMTASIRCLSRRPRRISSHGGIYVQKAAKSNITDTQEATFDFGNLNVVWQHRTWGTSPDPEYPWAAFIYGEKGTLKASTERYEFVPVEGKGPTLRKDKVTEKDQYPNDPSEPEVRAHMRNFLAAVESRGRPVADIEQGHISTASCILANLAMHLGRPLAYDPGRRQVTGDAQATRLLRRAYRGPWKHPGEAT